MNMARRVKKRIAPILYFTGLIVYMELILKLFTCKTFFDIGLIFMPVFSLIAGAGLQLICSFFEPKRWKRVAGIGLFALTVLYVLQSCYHWFFNKYLIIYSLVSGGVSQVLEGGMSSNVWEALMNSMAIVILLVLPLLFHLCFAQKVVDIQWRGPKRRIQLAVILGLHLVISVVISLIPSVRRIQSGLFDPNQAMGSFGLLRTEALDIKYNLLGIGQIFNLQEVDATITPGGDEETGEEEPISGDDEDQENERWTGESGENESVGESGQMEGGVDGTEVEEPSSEKEPLIWDRAAYHVSGINFNALFAAEEDEILKKMNGYFAEQIPTEKNAYTGMYEGYNLISVVAEAFSPYAIDEELTPTLYQLYQEGFRFTEFYTPIWGVSTTDGEYTICTGLLPKAGVWSMYESSENDMPYCLGNQFRMAGVENVFAYHNNSYTYYHRDQSHPNMGYHFTGIGNGLEDYVENVWPQSDLEMVEGSLPDYLSGDERFHAYYMTVSGHLDYTYEQNAMVRKNWDLVKELECSDLLKGYYACNIELDRAIAKLLEELQAAGIAEKTVIAITPDHYPYGLEQAGRRPMRYGQNCSGTRLRPNLNCTKAVFSCIAPERRRRRWSTSPAMRRKFCPHC